MPTVVPVPQNEQQRLAKLRQYRVLDTPPSESFDRITRLASSLLRMPVALVSLVDQDRQWFKSKVGLDADETPREHAFCAHAICDTTVMVVPNAKDDPRFADNPLVTGAPDICFYAGAPLRTEDGFNMGTLCVIDSTPREFSEEDRALLTDLAHIVIDELELRTLASSEQGARKLLYDAIEAAPDAFVYYDPEDRLALCNQRYREFYAESAELIVEGIKFEDGIRYGVQQGQYPAAIGNEETWIAKRLELHRNPKGPIEQELPDGRWMRIEERRTADGGTVGFRTDITELKQREFELERLAATDPLTGAMNRRRFLEAGEREFRRGLRYDVPLSVILFDVDHFKKVNDTFGHTAGDDVLRHLVTVAQESLREHDLLCRYGGEEFAVLLPETDSSAADVAARRLRIALEESVIHSDEHTIQVTASFGCTQVDVHGDSLESALSRADEALYEAKETGRNRVVFKDAARRALRIAE